MFVIPTDRLPPGFAERIESPPTEPAEPRPASTAVLLREGETGPEALLLRRNRSSGFVPGAYVFPGGRVDEADADPSLIERTDGLAVAAGSVAVDPDAAGSDAAGSDGAVSARPDGADPELVGPAGQENDRGSAEWTDRSSPPAPAYWAAAVREVFEETGVLLARGTDGELLPDAWSDARLAEWREALMRQEATLAELLRALELRLALDGVVYLAHWITPLAEARRYDTRFFLARLPEGREAKPDPREMTDAVWLTPERAIERFRAGDLPMVFPTVATLESLVGFESVDHALESWRRRIVQPILPRLVRTPEGVGIVVD